MSKSKICSFRLISYSSIPIKAKSRQFSLTTFIYLLAQPFIFCYNFIMLIIIETNGRRFFISCRFIGTYILSKEVIFCKQNIFISNVVSSATSLNIAELYVNTILNITILIIQWFCGFFNISFEFWDGIHKYAVFVLSFERRFYYESKFC